MALRPVNDLGPYYVGDSVPDWQFTVTGLTSSSVFDGAQVDIDDPNDDDMSIGSPFFTLTVVDTSTLTVAMQADTGTFALVGRYTGQLTLKIGTRLFGVQKFVFDVKSGPRDS